jgi:hypothetical protein
MEESLLFFQNAFTKLISSDDFNKNYAYNIRHMYGKEGKRQSYTAFSCTSIIMGPRSNPNEIGSHHGCPFAHNSDSSLNALLSGMSIGPKEREEILTLKKNNQFGLACAKHFEVTHPGADKMTGGKDGEAAVTMDGGENGRGKNAAYLTCTHYLLISVYSPLPSYPHLLLILSQSSPAVGNHPNGWFQASTSYWKNKDGNKAKDQKAMGIKKEAMSPAAAEPKVVVSPSA